MNHVYITAFSSISSLGIGIDETIKKMKNNINTLHLPDKDEKFQKPYFMINDKLPVESKGTLCAKLALSLLNLIEKKWINLGPIPVFLGTSTGGLKETEEVYKTLVNTDNKYDLSGNDYFYDIREKIKDRYKNIILDGYTFATACSSSGHSIFHAYRYIKHGIIKKALVLAVDSLSITTLFGFDSLKLVSEKGTRPLSIDRDGLTLGEGGGIILLESNPEVKPIAEILGVASNSDGYHITAPNPTGMQQKECILNALVQSVIDKNEINYINAHGTGTPTNDEVEINVIKSLFNPGTTVTSLKGFIGHTVGSSAIIELAICLGMIKENIIFQQSNIGKPLDDEYIPVTNVPKKVKYFLKNSFGFGGNNVSMIIKNLADSD